MKTFFLKDNRKVKAIEKYVSIITFILIFITENAKAQINDLKYELPPPLSLTPTLNPQQGATVPKVIYHLEPAQLSVPPLAISARMVSYYAAAPSKSEKVRKLKHQAAGKLHELKVAGWEIIFEGLWAILSFENFNISPASELATERARKLYWEWLKIEKEIEGETGDKAKALHDYEEHLKNLLVYPSGYSVQIKDAAIHINGYEPRAEDIQPQEKITPEVLKYTDTQEGEKWTIQPVARSAGFDKNGDPHYDLHYEIVRSVNTVTGDK